MYMLLKHIVYQLAHHLILFIVQHYEFEKSSIPQQEEQKVKLAKKLAEFGMSLPRYERILQEEEILPLS